MIPFNTLTRRIIVERFTLNILALILFLLAFHEVLIDSLTSTELTVSYVAVGLSFLATAYHYKRVSYFLTALLLILFATSLAKMMILHTDNDVWFGGIWTVLLLSQGFVLLKNLGESLMYQWVSTAIGGVILTLGVVAWTGWFVEISSYFPWLLPNQIDLMVSLSMIFLGTGILIISGMSVYQWANYFPVWIFVSSSVIVFILSVSICIAQISMENSFLEAITQAKANNSVSIVKESLGVYELTLKNALMKAEKEGGDSRELSEIDFIYSVIAPDELNNVVWLDPKDPGELGSADYQAFINVDNYDDKLIIALQLEAEELPTGTILSVFHSKNLFNRLFPETFSRDFAIVVTKNDDVIHNNSEQDYRYRDMLGSKKAFTMFNEQWVVEVWPTASMVIQRQSVIAPTTFLVGAITSFLVGTTLYFFFTARNHAYKVEQANKAKSAFLLNITHEVRTPLNGIIGTASLIANTNLNSKQERFVNIIEKSGKQLLSLVNDILDISSLESGSMELQYSDVNLHKLITSTTRMYAEHAAKKGIDLIIDYPRLGIDTISIDSKRFRQMLSNLIGNAIKFTKEGYVRITVRTDKLGSDSSLLAISVEDTGIGIDEDQHSTVFGIFNTSDHTYTKTHSGCGLGLSISKQLAEAMGGQLTIESIEGKGASLILKMPVKSSSSRDSFSLSSKNKLANQSILIVSADSTMKDVFMRYAEDWGMMACSTSNIYDVLDMIYEGGNSLPSMYNYILFDGDSSDIKGSELASLLTTKHLQDYAVFIELTNMSEMSKSNLTTNSFINVIYKPLTSYEFKEAVEALKVLC